MTVLTWKMWECYVLVSYNDNIIPDYCGVLNLMDSKNNWGEPD